MSYAVEPIGFVQGGKTDLEDDKWGLVEATIVIGDRFGEESLAGLHEFSHLDVAFLFHRVDESAVEVGHAIQGAGMTGRRSASSRSERKRDRTGWA
jgi:tRNA (Thr-GGU) A37 N-methylase